MAQVESIDWTGKRVFLHQDTVTAGVSGISIYSEVRDEVFANNTNGQNFYPPLTKEGGVSKGGGRFTPTYTEWRSGWRFVPHPNAGLAYKLDVLDEIISLDGLSDRDVADRSGIATNVDIDSVYDPVEIREVLVGSSTGGVSPDPTQLEISTEMDRDILIISGTADVAVTPPLSLVVTNGNADVNVDFLNALEIESCRV